MLPAFFAFCNRLTMDKETLLAELTTSWEIFMQALEGVPHEELERPASPGGWSVKEICAFLTAWDGEALRRIEFISGTRPRPPHDPHDHAYWDVWSQKQVEIKSIMSVQGILVDMVGTRQRFLTRVAELSDVHFQRWLAEDPQATQPYYAHYLQQVQSWRVRWEQARPSAKGLKKVWPTLKAWLKSTEGG